MNQKQKTQQCRGPIDVGADDPVCPKGIPNCARPVSAHGITLIALVITIIILLILAGVAINLVVGENGILNNAKKGGEEYTKAAIKEKVEATILDLEMEKIYTGETLTVDEALEGIQQKNIFTSINKEEQTGTCEGYIVQLGTNENGKVVILEIEKDTETRIIATILTEGYTKGKVEINITTKGREIKELIIPTGMTKKQDEIYEVENNGTYLVQAKLSNGETIEKEIKIATIDTLPPQDFTITAEGTTRKLTITANAEDTEATQTNACSGIDKYEYYVKRTTEENYTKYDTNTITEGLTAGTYNIYVIAYDKAGNPKQSTNTVETTLITPPASNYGQGEKVNYTANGISDWKIFYKDETRGETYIITSDYLPNEKVPANLGIEPIQDKQVHWNSSAVKKLYTGSESISQEARDRFKLSWADSYPTSTHYNILYVAPLMDTEKWSSFATKEGSYAIGGPTLEMWVASWNDWYPENRIGYGMNDLGYMLGPDTGEEQTGSLFDIPSEKKNNRLFVLPDTFDYRGSSIGGTKNPYNGYWLASPVGREYYYRGSLCNLRFGILTAGMPAEEDAYYFGLRPVVSLPSSSLSYNSTTDSWDVR